MSCDSKPVDDALPNASKESIDVLARKACDTFINVGLDCVKLLDVKGRLLWMNTGGQRSMEISDVFAVVGKPWVEFWSDAYREIAIGAVESALNQTTARFIGCCATLKGTSKWWDVVVSPVCDSEGRVQYLLAVSRDVSEYVTLYQERDDLLERERRARVEIDRMTRRSDYAVLVTVHELGAPLYAVRGWAQLLQLGDVRPAELTEAIDAIQHNTDRQCRLVEQLLAVVRARLKKNSPDLLPNAVSTILTEAVEYVRPVARAKNIDIDTDIETECLALADFDELQRAFSNLMFNAVKFTPEGGTIAVRCVLLDGSIQVDIRDSGVGIAIERLADVFEPFVQISENGQSSRPGVGIGLSIVRDIVRAHGGAAVATSPGPGKGSTFTITLPAFRRSASTIQLRRHAPVIAR